MAQRSADPSNTERAPATPAAATPRQRKAFISAFGGWMLDGYNAGIFGLVLSPALSELLPDVEVGLVEDSSHAFLLEYPQELAAGIKSFLHESGDD